MDKYICQVCAYVYDPKKGDEDNNIEKNTEFKDISEEWVCPRCNAKKDKFKKQS